MKPRNIVYRRPLNTMPNPRKSPEKVSLERAQKLRDARQGKTQRELLIEAGIITPRKGRG